ncbi:MAG: DUF4445 domain-containing protein [Clostridia bacterium]|nr:DUF4445 domain-containing protein [Clostridia bacterium]
MKLYFVNEDKCAAVSGGTLMQAMIEAGIAVDAPCGGHGSCGKCIVELRRPGSWVWERVRACQTAVDSDMEIRTLRSGELSVLTGGSGGEIPWKPCAEAVQLQLPRQALGKNASAWDRLTAALEAATGQNAWQPELSLLDKLCRLDRENGGALWAVVGENRVLDVSAEEPRVCMAAFDLGTTSIAGYLIENGKTIAELGAGNPQAKFGADVISRAEYALEHGTRELADCVRTAVDELLGRLCAEAGVERSSVFAVAVAGNSCMHHLFLNISPESLVRAPYNPAIRQGLALRAAEYGISAHGNALLLMLPVIAGFVGADTVACLLAGDWEKRENCTLLIDVGTNGELVLGNKERMIACSTAAGPAFEGAKIECGMRGAEGAIDRVWIENGKLRWHVIGDAPARGICGSGLVDLAAALLEMEIIDGGGRLEGGSFSIGDSGVALIQKDVRELQLAKAAIAAGIRLLAGKLGVALADIREVHIAGAFGSALNPESACAIGLIPAELRDKIRPVGNAAGEGTKRALANREFWKAARRLADKAEFLELATLPEFQDEFVDALAFFEEE